MLARRPPAKDFASIFKVVLTGPFVSRLPCSAVVRGMLTSATPPGEQSGDDDARMRYTSKCYASEVVVKGGCKVVGWPEDIPFKSVSEIRGGVAPLFELRRRWNLPDGHQDKLRIERATPEDITNAIRDPDSVHPNLKLLKKERKEAADAATAATKDAEYVVPVYAWHPDDMCFVGLELVSTAPPEPKSQRSQRIDSGLRRKRASDGSPWAREKLSMTKGISSSEYVIPGVHGSSGGGGGGGERASKRMRLDDCVVDDPIEDFVLSSEFGGPLPATFGSA